MLVERERTCVLYQWSAVEGSLDTAWRLGDLERGRRRRGVTAQVSVLVVVPKLGASLT